MIFDDRAERTCLPCPATMVSPRHLSCNPFLRLNLQLQLIFSVFKTLTDQTVIVELKNDLLITGVLKSVDQSVW
jgi:hypothetical protein